MKFPLNSLLNTTYKFKSIYQSTTSLSQSSKRISGSIKKHNDGNRGNKPRIPTEGIIIGAVVAGYLGYRTYHSYYDNDYKKKEEFINTNPWSSSLTPEELQQVSSIPENEVGRFKHGLPTYSLTEIRKHDTMKERIWVSYKDGVYDITNYIKLHPGGPQILKAAGSTLEPFFNVIYQHHQKEYIYGILENYRIGNLEKDDPNKRADSNDPFSKDPIRHAALYPIVKKPFNGGTEPALLVDNFYTPNELFYVRNHMYVPHIDPEKYTLEVEVDGQSKKLTFSLDDLKSMPKHTVTATLMCIGNRRTEMLKIKDMSAVVRWDNSAMGCAKWTGVFLRDVLKLAGVDGENENHKHVHFEGYDHDSTGTHFAGSIPIWRAVDKRTDVLLAYEMNGQPLPRDHGYPLRLFLPGCAGVRQIKWLAKIFVTDHESQAHWYQNEYKGFSPSTDWHNVDFSSAPAAQETPVTSSICNPVDGDVVEVIDGKVTFKGYAWSGNGSRIVRIDITADGGKTWLLANLKQLDTQPPKHWTWTLWSIDIPVADNVTEIEVWAKAVDSCYNSQPESFENIYNFRGVYNNAYPRVKVKLKR